MRYSVQWMSAFLFCFVLLCGYTLYSTDIVTTIAKRDRDNVVHIHLKPGQTASFTVSNVDGQPGISEDLDSEKLPVEAEEDNEKEKEVQEQDAVVEVTSTSSATETTSASAEPIETIQREPPPKEDKIVVVGHLEEEDMGWIAEELPEWQTAIFKVDDTMAALHTDENKGHEAIAYLTYIVYNYDNMPSTIAFTHAHRDNSWHIDNDANSNVVSLRALQIPYVQQQGYTNLRCQTIPGCPDEVRLDLKGDAQENAVEEAMRLAWPTLMGNQTAMPPVIAAPCCAQFAVSRAQIHARPLEHYERYLQWIKDTDLSDDISGRVFEYLWHIIFGRPAVYCPNTEVCYCMTYDWCAKSERPQDI